MSKILLENPGQKPKQKFKKKLWIWFSIILVIILAIVGGYYYYGDKIFTKNSTAGSPILKKAADGNSISLSQEDDSRINILFLGYQGAGSQGAFLTDTIQVASIDPINKTYTMISIPRDLYVKISSPSYAGKINGVYEQGAPIGNSKYDGAALIKQEVGTIIDVPIHYYVGVSLNGFVQEVNNIGGLDLNVAKRLVDYNYPATMYDTGPVKTVTFSAGMQHMDGATALEYARSRESTSDFDRSGRQQIVISAFVKKLLSLGTLSNPAKIAGLVNIASSSIKTDLSLSEIDDVATIIKQIDTTKTTDAVIDNSATGPLYGATIDGQDCLTAKGGNWTQVQEFAHQYLPDPFITKEAAQIELKNAAGKTVSGNNVSKFLKSYGYNIIDTVVAPETQTKTIIYDYSGGKKKYTLQFLASRLNAKVIGKSKPAGSTLDLEIIIGQDKKDAYANTSN